ncbi:MAG TPA: hypothetical protein VFW91_08435 [Candidatus Binatia bacterium]|jgi:hypothetical protein|nr:hypothetical protein [Candidatus Binatia bacterium]
MAEAIDGTKTPHHGLFYMENAGGSKVESETPVSTPADEHQPSCFALEEERGEGWKGSGAAKSEINEAKPSL